MDVYPSLEINAEAEVLPPPGLDSINAIFPNNHALRKDWNELIDNFHLKLQPVLRLYLKHGQVSLSPLLLKNEFELVERPLEGVHCAFLNGHNAKELLHRVSRLLKLGVSNFSIQVSGLCGSIDELCKMLVIEVPSSRRIHFQLWVDLHCTSFLEVLCFSKHGSENCLISFGLLVPAIFLKKCNEKTNWILLKNTVPQINEMESIVSASLYRLRGKEYEEEYERLASTVPDTGKIQIAAKDVLEKIADSYYRRAFCVFNRDMMFSDDNSFSDLLETGRSTCIPNHLGETPTECFEKTVLQITAFVNVDICATLASNKLMFYACNAAHDILRQLKLSLEQQLNKLQDVEQFEIRCNVGLIGLHDQVNEKPSRVVNVDVKNPSSKTLGEKKKKQKRCCNNPQDAPHNCAKVTEKAVRHVTAVDFERYIVPLIRNGFKVFPLTGMLSSLMWNVSEGVWTMYNAEKSIGNSKIYSKQFLSWKRKNWISDTDEKHADTYVDALCASDPLQVEMPIVSQLRAFSKISSLFFSPPSMVLTATRKDAEILSSPEVCRQFFSNIFLENLRNSAYVLLPFIQSQNILRAMQASEKSKRTNTFLDNVKNQLWFGKTIPKPNSADLFDLLLFLQQRTLFNFHT